MDEQNIIELYFQRDETAIKETASKYGSYCFRIANNILADRQDAEECLNDTWIKAWNAIPPQRPTSLKIFLGKITRNLSLDRYREQNRNKRGGGEIALALDEMEEFLAGTSDVESELERENFMRMLNCFLHTLPERECNIFVCRYFYMNSVSDISRRYGLKESNVLVILSRTRKKLRERLEREGYTI